MNTTTEKPKYLEKIRAALSYCVTETHYPEGKKYRGKVRDTYDLGDQLLLITTDRQSAFNRILGAVPYKGQVLNLASAWWFDKTAHIVPNHMISMPDSRSMLAKKCEAFPIEFIVRGYITGSTDTSLWIHYEKGERNYCGHHFPDGLRKNQQLKKPILTPTTKEVAHDHPISAEDIVKEGWMTQADFDVVADKALELYQYGAEVAAKHGLILVDTKYEFGKDKDGRIVLIDEIHTPDSSRYWLMNSYVERFTNKQEPENIDKEFLRLWFIDHCDPYSDAVLPAAPEELIVTLSSRYIQLYEMITGLPFQL